MEGGGFCKTSSKTKFLSGFYLLILNGSLSIQNEERVNALENKNPEVYTVM